MMIAESIYNLSHKSHISVTKKKAFKNMSFLQLNFLTSEDKATNYGTNEEIALARPDTHRPAENSEPAGGAHV